MKKAFELVPLLVAGGIGALAMYLIISQFDATNTKQQQYTLFGFVTGLLVQIGVRLVGVS